MCAHAGLARLKNGSSITQDVGLHDESMTSLKFTCAPHPGTHRITPSEKLNSDLKPMKTPFLSVVALVMFGVSSNAMATIYKCPDKSGVYVYTTISCADGFRREGSQWIDIAAERKKRMEAAEERKKRQEGESSTQEQPVNTNQGASKDTLSKPQSAASASAPSAFKCDERIHCSQMTSCEEAKFFLQNCPNVKMDGDNDGVPYEEQWCR